ncbi:MAG: transposase [Halobacteriales archaeon]|jgi:transposase
MNRRMHSLSFAALQKMVSYKTAWNEIPLGDVDPAYTSQLCQRTETLTDPVLVRVLTDRERRRETRKV